MNIKSNNVTAKSSLNAAFHPMWTGTCQFQLIIEIIYFAWKRQFPLKNFFLSEIPQIDQRNKSATTTLNAFKLNFCTLWHCCHLLFVHFVWFSCLPRMDRIQIVSFKWISSFHVVLQSIRQSWNVLHKSISSNGQFAQFIRLYSKCLIYSRCRWLLMFAIENYVSCHFQSLNHACHWL